MRVCMRIEVHELSVGVAKFGGVVSTADLSLSLSLTLLSNFCWEDKLVAISG